MKTLAALALCALPFTFAQAGDTAGGGSPHTQVFAKHWTTSRDYTLALAKQMPAEDYSFKPNDAEMSFGEQLVHIAQANMYFMASIAGEKPDMKKPALDKDSVIKYVTDSFDYGSGVLGKATEAQLMKSYKMEDQNMNGLEVIELAMNHTSHHRGQIIVYLRIKNIKPTDYQF